MNLDHPPVDPFWIRGPADELAISEGCWFDPEAGDRCIRFLEKFCRQSKGGRWAGQPLKLLPWQRDFIMRLFGWKRADGTRRYRTFYVEVPKKNGKSTLLSGLILYMAIADGEPGAEVYVCAYDKSQAGIIFDEAEKMVNASPSLNKVLTVTPSAKTIAHAKSTSRIRALSADVPSKDGINSHFAIFDELHRQRTSALWDIMRYAGASRDQPLFGAITTAGSNRQSICFRQHDYSKKVNAGIILDTTHLGIIYGAEPGDDIEDPATWAKANPSLGYILKAEDFAVELKAALESPSTLNNWLRLRLNLWTQADERFLPEAKWDACGKVQFEAGDLAGEECHSGLDLASTIDIAALVHVFGEEIDGIKVLCRFWIPEECAELRERRDQVPYLTWARQGLITLTPGNVIDYAFIRAQILADAKLFQMRKLYADKWNASQLLNELQEEGLDVQTFGQGFLSQNEPTKYLERLILSGRLHHGDNEVLNWMADNAMAVTDPAGNVKLDKKKSTEKIDGMAALVNALAAKIAPDSDGGPSIYSTRKIMFLR